MFEHVSPVEVVAVLAETDVEVLPTPVLARVMADAAAVVAWAESMGLAAVAELRSRRQAEHQQLCEELGAVGRDSRAEDSDEVDRFCAVEVAAVLQLSQRAATDRVALADDLATRLTATMRQLGVGRLGLPQARAIRDAVSFLDPDQARAVESDVLPEAGSRTTGQLAAAARRAATRLGPAAAAARCAEARAARRADAWGLDDGVAALRVVGPAETVAGAWARVDALARQAQDAARQALRRLEVREGVAPEGDVDCGVPSLDQLRADTVLRLLAGTHDLTEQPSPFITVGVDVLVPVGTVLGASDAPAELAGHGPLPAAVARALAAGAGWRRVLVAPDGTVVTGCGAATGAEVADGVVTGDGPGDQLTGDHVTGDGPGGHVTGDGPGEHVTGDARGSVAGGAGPPVVPPDGRHRRTTYRPSAELARAVRARDVTCRFPGCRRAALRCDLDHTVPHPDGPTAGCNLACLCRLHHRVKHRAGWRLEQLSGGRLRWTSPSGMVMTTDPPAVAPCPPGVRSGPGATGAATRHPTGRVDDGEDEDPPWAARGGGTPGEVPEG
ncbi:DUF222 domain-containing protein [Aquipuribacter sp. MA13-6]|uniref:HNH endonuclease signature motif containing protein n=1 Tax=Aquipuribacter sp. MA13-6 TaxID=3440839 RepID=UPI003EEFAEBD